MAADSKSSFAASSGQGTLTVAVENGIIAVSARTGEKKIQVKLSPLDFLNFAEAGRRMAKDLRTPGEK